MAAASEQTVLQFAPTASSNTLSAKVHPLVIFNICDCYVRRPDQSERVIGTLLGSVLPDGTVDIRNSFAVPHNESSDQEVIVGWYSTGLGVTGGSALIHDFYSDEVSNPVHLTVDTGFRNGELDILKTTMVDKLPTDLEGMEASMQRLLALIDDIYKYVDDVVQGNTAPDNSVGRLLSEIVASLPKLSPAVLDKLVNDNMQDHLLLLYLSSITRTQLSLAEKLNTAAQII
ncbi:Eukaryotic translation initiation factor 3 subunit F [Linum perenne]